jgi:hypothetical protein
MGVAACVGVIALGSIRVPWRGAPPPAPAPVAAGATPAAPGPVLASVTPVVPPTPPAGAAVAAPETPASDAPPPDAAAKPDGVAERNGVPDANALAVADAPAADAATGAPPAAEAVPSAAATPSAAVPPSPAATREPDAEPAAPAPEAGEAAAAATPEPAAPPSPPADAVAALPAPAAPAPPPVLDVDAAVARLRPLDARLSAVRAVSALLGAWHAEPLAPDEPRDVNDLPRMAQRRGLEYLPLLGNVSMLRLLDLPAILELHLADAGVRYVTLTALGGGRAILALDGSAVAVDSAVLERHWFGQAHLLWRDFESLGATLKPNASGASVNRIQKLLERMGLYRGPTSGVYDPATVDAVTAFQRSRLLLADGWVGPLTRIVLYAAVGGYPRPTLVEPAGATS